MTPSTQIDTPEQAYARSSSSNGRRHGHPQYIPSPNPRPPRGSGLSYDELAETQSSPEDSHEPALPRTEKVPTQPKSLPKDMTEPIHHAIPAILKPCNQGEP